MKNENAEKDGAAGEKMKAELLEDIDEIGAKLKILCDKLTLQDAFKVDPRWSAVGKTNLQQGIMALTRSVEQPDHF